jgi:competence protein ComGC
MKRLLFFIALMVIAVPGFSQDKEKVEKQDKTQAKKAVVEEIQLDALHLDATVEKPSVSILPRRLKPELERRGGLSRNWNGLNLSSGILTGN